MRHRELSKVLPQLSAMNVHTLIVTSAVIPIPMEWMTIPRVRVAVSVDGLPEHHDIRRQPATYERILQNIKGRTVNIHWTITRPMLSRPSYLEEYVSFWDERPEVNRIWVSLYSPQIGEDTAEMLTPMQRRKLVDDLVPLRQRYPKFLINDSIGKAFVDPPASPRDCLFARMSTNYSADLKTRVEPCIFGGTPDCSQCGCAISSGLHGASQVHLLGLVSIDQLVRGSMAIGSTWNRLRSAVDPHRWKATPEPSLSPE